MLKGKPVALDAALDAARRLIAAAKHPVALVSSWGSNEELAAFAGALGGRLTRIRQAGPGARARRTARGRPPHPRGQEPEHDGRPQAASAMLRPRSMRQTDLVLVWGEGFDFSRLPASAKIIFLNAWLQPENGHADVFFPISVQTERSGHYTNFQGTVSAFEPCFAKEPGVVDAEAVFAALAAAPGSRP